MDKWLDRMINGGFILIPVGIAIAVFVLTRFGCGSMPTKETESDPVVKTFAVSTDVRAGAFGDNPTILYEMDRHVSIWYMPPSKRK